MGLLRALRDAWNLSHTDKLRLMQCVYCRQDPTKCRCTEDDEDENGMCTKYNGDVVIEEDIK